ncbi:MAG: diguanylate cyclase [Bacillota bacterium]
MKFKLITILLIIIILVFTTMNIITLNKQMILNTENEIINDLDSVGQDFSIWMTTKKKIVETSKDFIKNFSYEKVVKEKTLNPYLNINNNDASISQIYIGLKNGEFITGGRWVPPSDYDPRKRVWYNDAVSADETVFSRVYIDRETGLQLVTISSPLYLEGEFVGVISADVFLDDILSFLKDKLKNKDSYAVLLDHNGNIVINTRNKNLNNKSLYEIGTDLMINHFEKVKLNEKTMKIKYSFDDLDVLGMTKKVPDIKWYLLIALDQEKIDYNLDDYKVFFITTFVFIMIIIFLIFRILKLEKHLVKENTLLIEDNEKDFLTNLYNKRYFTKWLDNIWEDCIETSQSITILMMDLDYFKKYNDYYGHIEGDKVLKKVSSIISNTIRDDDILARFGGEEFILAIKGISSSQGKKIAIKIKENIYDEKIKHKTSPLEFLTISIGVATLIPREDITIKELINNADEALYEAKKVGKNSVVCKKGS